MRKLYTIVNGFSSAKRHGTTNSQDQEEANNVENSVKATDAPNIIEQTQNFQINERATSGPIPESLTKQIYQSKKEKDEENLSKAIHAFIERFKKSSTDTKERSHFNWDDDSLRPPKHLQVARDFQMFEEDIENSLAAVRLRYLMKDMVASVEANMGLEPVETELMAKFNEAQKMVRIGVSTSRYLKEQVHRSYERLKIMRHRNPKASVKLSFLVALHFINIVTVEKKALTVTAMNKSLVFHIAIVLGTEFVAKWAFRRLSYETLFKVKHFQELFECRNMFVEVLGDKKVVPRSLVITLASKIMEQE